MPVAAVVVLALVLAVMAVLEEEAMELLNHQQELRLQELQIEVAVAVAVVILEVQKIQVKMEVLVL
jgi:hypothetical protein